MACNDSAEDTKTEYLAQILPRVIRSVMMIMDAIQPPGPGDPALFIDHHDQTLT